MTRDIRGVPVSCDDARALERYERALLQYQTYVGDAVGTIDEALAERPDFLLGHVFRAGVLMTFLEQRFTDMARAGVRAAEALAGAGNDRERALFAAVRRLAEGDWDAGCAGLDAVLVEHPRDVFALQTAHIFDFFRGDALNLRNRVSRVLPHWSESVPGYSFVLGFHAFGLEECNQYPEAEDTARRALALEPRDAWSVHAGVHVLEMTGRVEEGISWLESRRADWAPDNLFAYHNWWHLALLHMDRARWDRVLELYDGSVWGTPSDVALQLVDATSLLWRLQLLGVETGERMGALADVWEAKLDHERGFYAFNDVHALMALAGAGRHQAAERLLAGMESSRGASNAHMAREVGMPVARGLLAFARGHWDEAISALAGVRDVANRFGGSHAQRDLITLTIVVAGLRAGHRSLARHYLAERNVHRPASALGWRLHAAAS